MEMTTSPQGPLRPFRRGVLVGLFILAAIVSLALAFSAELGMHCRPCSGGLLSKALPWAGMGFYSLMAALSYRWPGATLNSALAGLYIFVHSSLVAEMLLTDRLCWGCLIVAALAGTAGFLQLGGASKEVATGLVALVLGILSGWFSPFDHGDDLLTRLAWPSRVLESVPTWVNREELTRCDHSSRVRILLYENGCKCGGAMARLGPRLARDFPSGICVHSHDRPIDPKGQMSPLFVLTSGNSRIVVFEGYVEYETLKSVLQDLLSVAPLPAVPAPAVPDRASPPPR